jgi:dTDP-D-glucose 4,6-dehydratase
LGKTILEECKSDAKITHRPPRAGDVKVSMASTQALRATGWKPQYEFKTSLKKTVRWFLDNRK